MQLGELVDQLLDYHRDLMVIAAGAGDDGAGQRRCHPAASAGRTDATLGTCPRSWRLQILAETKTRMQRSGHGRALGQLALVRLTLLEETLDLAALVDELRSPGGASGGPQNRRARGERAAGRKPALYVH